MSKQIAELSVGCLGGGQLGRMMAQAASRLGCQMTVLDPGGVDSPAGRVCGAAVTGAFTDPSKIRELSALVDVVTVEIEHVDAGALAAIEKEGVSVHPSAATLALIQDKYEQKRHLVKVPGVAVGDFCDIPDTAALLDAGRRWGYPLMLKAKRFAYDGRGNLPVSAADEAEGAFASLSRGGEVGLYAEKWCPFTKELAVMVARSKSGETASYPVVETVQKDSICHSVIAPANASAASVAEASKVASAAIASLSGGGIFGVELFLLADGSVLLNEIAPRPHSALARRAMRGAAPASVPTPRRDLALASPDRLPHTRSPHPPSPPLPPVPTPHTCSRAHAQTLGTTPWTRATRTNSSSISGACSACRSARRR
jgi:phosphoribosylaminoimidazole carboxylase